MTKQPQTGLIGRFYRQVENRPKNRTKTEVIALLLVILMLALKFLLRQCLLVILVL